MDTKTRLRKINFSGLQHCRKARSIQYKIILTRFHYYPKHLSHLLAESVFKRSRYNLFQSNTLPIFSPYEYIHGQVSPATLSDVGHAIPRKNNAATHARAIQFIVRSYDHHVTTLANKYKSECNWRHKIAPLTQMFYF